MRVSVIVRTKDRPRLLAEALESLRRQTMTDFETIVVNDGGTPPSGATLSPAPGRSLRVVPTEAPRGRARALNTGLHAALGTLVSYLDDDDLFLPDHLETLCEALDGSAAGAVYGSVEQIDQVLLPDGTYRDAGRRTVYGRAFDANRLLSVNDIPIIALVHDRAAARDAGGFDESFDLFEDWDFLIRLAARTPFLHVPKITAVYRVRSDGTNVTDRHPWGGPESQAARRRLFEKHWHRRTADSEIALLDGLERDRHEVARRAVEAEDRAREAEGRASARARERDDAEGRAQKTEARLSAATDLLAATEARLSAAEAGLADVGSRLGAAQADLAGTRSRLAATEAGLEDARALAESRAAALAELDVRAASERQAAAAREAALGARCRDAEGLVAQVTGSLTWRLMTPYWKLKERLKR